MEKLNIQFSRRKNSIVYKFKNKRVVVSTSEDIKNEFNTEVTTMKLVIVEDIEARKKLLKHARGLLHHAVGREYSKYVILHTFLELDMLTSVAINHGLEERLTNKNKQWPNKIIKSK